MSIKERLGKELLFFDGAMGTILQENGLAAGELPELWNILHPEKIYAIHKSYLDAGADIIMSNTFGANGFKIPEAGYTVEEVVTRGIEIAKKAIADSGREAYVALDISSTGKLMKPFGDLEFDDAYETFKEMVIAGERAGADCILFETMSDVYEIKAQVLAAKENSSLPIMVTMVFDEAGKLLTGASIEAAVALLEGLGVDALGFNCGLGPEQMQLLLPRLIAAASVPVIVNPNAGLPVVENGKTVFKVGPEEFAKTMAELVRDGVALIGGCCGTTPAHIAALKSHCGSLPIVPVTEKHISVVSSPAMAVEIGKAPVLIGERINPTGKKLLKEALRKKDMDYLYREGLSQAENGAHILDVNVGLPEIDEPAMLVEAVKGLQAITNLPLQLDTSDVVAMERAMRIYNGKPLINSVNGKKESMDAVFPLVKHYGGMVVALTLDEGGIPETAEGRIAIAEKVIKEAEKYGIKKKDIIVDPLAMTISTGQENAQIAFDCLDYLRHTIGVNTVLGVSNISFGLPRREVVTSIFFSIAMERGLSAGIINPLSNAMMNAYYSYCALKGYDENCVTYIEQLSSQTANDTIVKKAAGSGSSDNETMTLHHAVMKGLKDMTPQLTKELLKEQTPISIIDEILIPALDEVGKGFEKNTIFLPQLLMSADAAKNAFDILKQQISNSGQASEKKGTVLLATVKGDIHDIGKNIVKVLLENYGFDIVDMGKDVEPEDILSTAKKEKIRLVGLSALMTTTVVNMEKTIELLHEEYPECKVMVGGAVLTEDYSKQIQADFYSKDAMGSVRYATELFSNTK